MKTPAVNAFKPGDRVRVVIEDAIVMAPRLGEKGLRLSYLDVTDQHPGAQCRVYASIQLEHKAPTVTVTRVAPAVQAGDVWRLADGTVWHISSDEDDDKLIVTSVRHQIHRSFDDRDFVGAELLFRLPADDAGMLRRIGDHDGDVWVETAPSSGVYKSSVQGLDASPVSRDWVRTEYGPLADLDPIPASSSAVTA